MRRAGFFRYLSLAFLVIALIAVGFGSNILQPTAALAAELPPRPPVNPDPPRDPPPAVVSVVQKANPNVTVTPGSIVSYTFIVTNHGRGVANDTIITVPFDPSIVSVVDASTSRPETWVSAVNVDSVELRSGPLLSNGGYVTATLRMRLAADLPVGTTVAPRLSYTWNDRSSGGEGTGNLLSLVVGERNMSTARFPLSIETSENGFRFGAAIFVPNEPVGLWYVTPSGRNVELGTVRANEDGVIDLELLIGDDAPGDYSLVAYGLWSEFTAVGEYRLVEAQGRQ
jgi:hypothetical protein